MVILDIMVSVILTIAIIGIIYLILRLMGILLMGILGEK